MATQITVRDAAGANQVLPVPTAHAEEATLQQVSNRVNTGNGKLDDIKTSSDGVGAGVDRLRAKGGTEIVSDTAAHNGLDAHTLVVLSETAELGVLTSADVTGAVGVELPRGTVIVSEAGITAVTLASGIVALYLNA